MVFQASLNQYQIFPRNLSCFIYLSLIFLIPTIFLQCTHWRMLVSTLSHFSNNQSSITLQIYLEDTVRMIEIFRIFKWYNTPVICWLKTNDKTIQDLQEDFCFRQFSARFSECLDILCAPDNKKFDLFFYFSSTLRNNTAMGYKKKYFSKLLIFSQWVGFILVFHSTVYPIEGEYSNSHTRITHRETESD